MIDKMMNWLWAFVLITMVIAAAEKMSCLNL